MYFEDKKENTKKLKCQVRFIRCAVHTVQLTVSDVLKEEKAAAIINEGRGVCKQLEATRVKSVLNAKEKANNRLSYTLALNIGYVGTSFRIKKMLP